jgi:hypothetical protein
MPAQEATKIEPQSEADAKMVDLPDNGPAIDVELPTKTEKTINPDPEPEATEQEVKVEETASQGEMEDYGKKVQSRIDKLTKKLRETERREQAAIQYAQGVQNQAKELQGRVGNLDRGYVLEYGNRVKAETEDAKKRLKEAMDAGDIDSQVQAQQDLARLAIENERVKATEAKRERTKAAEGGQQVEQPQIPQQRMQQPPSPPDPKAESWAEKNEWFGKDEPMTLTSFSIHRKLVEQGFDPSSDDYYSEIDKQMKETFPHKFSSDGGNEITPTQTVASVNRSDQPAKRKGTVRLTPSQVAIAKKLGVPLSEYAKYVKE